MTPTLVCRRWRGKLPTAVGAKGRAVEAVNIVYHHRTRGAHVEGVHIRGIVTGLRELGHQVTVVSFPGADPERVPDSTNANKPNVKPANDGGLLRLLTRHLPEFLFELLELSYNALTFGRMGLRMLRQRPDLVYERYSLFLFATVYLCRLRGVPIVLEINDSALVERVRPLFFSRLARAIERRVLTKATGLVFISNAFKEIAEQAYGQVAPSVVSPNAADRQVFDPGRFDREAIRQELGIGDQLVCGFVGGFLPWHGVHWLVEEIIEPIRASDNLVLLLVGDGSMLEAVRQLVTQHQLEDRILLPGRVAHAEVPRYIAAMDFAVLPDSNVYGSPMKIFEFMAMGVAVVAPDFGPLREVIVDNQTGWLFPAKQHDKCVEQVLTVATDSSAIKRIGLQAKEYIHAERQWTNNAQDLLGLLER